MNSTIIFPRFIPKINRSLINLVSPNKKGDFNQSGLSRSQACYISKPIENEPYYIVDLTEENTEHNASIDSNALTEEESIVANGEVTAEINSESPEPDTLFFIDKNPATNFEAPIYEINSGPSIHTDQNMAQNFRIIVRNKENDANLDNSFAPNPLLSSTRLNVSCGEIEESTGSSSNNDSVQQSPMNFHISINSTRENGSVRRVSIGKSSPIASEAKASNDNVKNNVNNNDGSSNKDIASKAIKRKADNGIRDEPPSKRSHSESSDVIIVNDTVTDEEDSVVFVSETLDHQKRNRIALARGNAAYGRAADYISLGNNTANQNKNSPKSTRAKRKQERKKAEKERVTQGKFGKPNGIAKGQKNNSNNNNNSNSKKMSRFAVNTPITAFDRPTLMPGPSTATATVTSAKATKKKVAIEYEEEKKLFAEKPELFEKRMIVIDGSNLARSHGLKNKSYSIKGIDLCIKYFEDRGFEVRAVVPQMRLKRNMSTDPDALERMMNAGKVVTTPCKNLPGQRSSSYDDRMILEIAEHKNAVIISNDNYADLLNKSAEWDEIIKERVVGFTFCDDLIMIPEDPYGKNGRTLQLILHKLKDDAQVETKILQKPQQIQQPMQQLQKVQTQKQNNVTITKTVPPKYISGMFALCAACGYTSQNHAQCQRCSRVFTEEPKKIPMTNAATPTQQKPKTTASAMRTMALIEKQKKELE